MVAQPHRQVQRRSARQEVVYLKHEKNRQIFRGFMDVYFTDFWMQKLNSTTTFTAFLLKLPHLGGKKTHTLRLDAF